MMIKPLLHCYDLGDDVVAFSTTRHGGVSDVLHVKHDKMLLAKELGIDSSHVILPHQVHDTRMFFADDHFVSSAKDNSCADLLEGFDAICTNVRGVCIGVSTADCIPVLLYDKKHGLVTAIHAGWRGTVARIVEKSVSYIIENFAVSPNDLKAVIGPGISLKNFEVGQEVYDGFAAAGFDMNPIARKYPDHLNPKQEKWHIDLPLCNSLQLQRMGLAKANIFMSGICTYDNVDDYFSARRLGLKSGRIFNGIMLKNT